MEDHGLKGINKTLFDWAKKSCLIKYIGWLDGNEDALKKALGPNETECFYASINLSDIIWRSKYLKFGIPPNLFLLGKLETDQVYHPNYRDHSTHTFKVYLLGLYIYENNQKIKSLFADKDNFIDTWTVVSLWHDIGYLFENDEMTEDASANLLTDVYNEINVQFQNSLNYISGINPKLDPTVLNTFHVNSNTKYVPLKALSDLEANIKLFEHLRPAGIASGLATPKFKSNAVQTVYNVIRQHPTANRKKHIDHGIFSSLLLLNLWFYYESMITKIVRFVNNARNVATANLIAGDVRSCVENVNANIMASNAKSIIITAAQSIALHNIKIADVNSRELCSLGISIGNFKIFAEGNKAQPFAFLLKLVDELQDWDRQNYGRRKNGDSVLSGADMDISASPSDSYIWIWHNVDEDVANPETNPASLFYRKKAALSTIQLGELLHAMPNSHRDPGKIHESYEAFYDVFYNAQAEELMTHIKKKYVCTNVNVILYNRKKNQFRYLNKCEILVPIPSELDKNVRYHYFKNDSFFLDEMNKNKTGFSLISTPVGSLGFLVFENVSEKPSKAPNKYGHTSDISILDDYGLMYGALVFKNIKRKVYSETVSNISSSTDKDNADVENNTVTQMNDYVPLGHTPCIAIFMDIRGLSSLFDGDKQHEQLALKFIRKFSETVEHVSSIHYGIISCHFGGGMLITFNQVIREELDESCFRAICTMFQVKRRFDEELLPLAKKLFGDETAEQISLGMGASAGEAIFSTLGCSPLFYTGIGKNISMAKKIENISGRDLIEIGSQNSPLCKDKILISEDLFSKCIRKHSASLQSIEGVRIPYSSKSHKFHYIANLGSGKWCPLDRKCLICLNTDVETKYAK
ncbi:hypothetical protein [Candidatus Bathycorpusculum sp.]|uniref:hypothetical protein n=1 Tax=Candidatus Bathycorpusculum sp. TaxID=2994959 RepID=UPI00282FD467|nr:hypothetical protein [Candidatus Termitimicrobium sp.]